MLFKFNTFDLFMPKKILVVEDETAIHELVKYNLQKEGYTVLSAYDGAAGAETARDQKPDLILLDLMLPKMDGIEVCRMLKSNTRTAGIPIIMVTAKSEEADKVLGLEIGADDYLAKPFGVRELLARIKAVLRRQKKSGHSGGKEVFQLGDLVLDDGKHEATLKGKPLYLTSKEYDLLKALLEADGRVLSRNQLLDQVWGYEHSENIETRTIDMHVGQLRKKIKSEASRILTVKNVGYRIELDSE